MFMAFKRLSLFHIFGQSIINIVGCFIMIRNNSALCAEFINMLAEARLDIVSILGRFVFFYKISDLMYVQEPFWFINNKAHFFQDGSFFGIAARYCRYTSFFCRCFFCWRFFLFGGSFFRCLLFN